MLRQKISVKEPSIGSFVVYDCTGKYSATNTTGYGGPNYSISMIQKSTLFVQGPSDTEEYPHQVDVTGSLPNDEGLGLEVFPADIGQTEGPESGQYKFKLETVILLPGGSTKTLTSYYTTVLTRTLQCCIDKNNGTLDSNAFNDVRQKAIIRASTLFNDTLLAVEKGFYDQANKNIDYLKAQCKCPDC